VRFRVGEVRARLVPEALTKRFKIVAIAASAGGLAALRSIVTGLPADFGAIVLVLQHVDPRHVSLMPQLIGRNSKLPVAHAEDGVKVQAGHVYVAPPDRHMLVNADGTLSLTRTELVNYVRPSADLLFESVAAAFGARAIAVVLTGAGHDGARGVTAIKERGGTVLAQDEASSEFFSMPSAAIQTGSVDQVVSLDEMSGAIVKLVAGEVPA
jgi:two-component system chemotaxis response regulator CheB